MREGSTRARPLPRCTPTARVLNLSDAEAYLRIAVARASREHPRLLAIWRRRSTSPAPPSCAHLTRRTAIAAGAASRQSKRRIEELVAEVSPDPMPGVDPQAADRRPECTPLPQLRPTELLGCPTPANGLRRDPKAGEVEPLAGRYKVQFTASASCARSSIAAGADARLRARRDSRHPRGRGDREAGATRGRRYAKTNTPGRACGDDPSPTHGPSRQRSDGRCTSATEASARS